MRDGSFPWLADGHEPSSQAVGHRGAEDEPPALDTDDQIDLLVSERLGQPVEYLGQPDRVTQERRDVVEEECPASESPGMWRIFDFRCSMPVVSSSVAR